jgi:hypothetical protein
MKRECERAIWAAARGGALYCGHFLAEEEPDEVIAAVEGFLRD